jgi:hypothetical protein
MVTKGGNRRYKGFLDEFDLASTPEVKYLSNAAHYYSCLLTAQTCPDYQLEELTLPYSPKSEGWFSSIVGSAGSVLSYTADLGSRLATAVSSRIPGADSAIVSQVAEKSAEVISSVTGAASSVAEAASSMALNTYEQIFGHSEETKTKVEYVRLNTIKPASNIVNLEPDLTVSQAIIDCGDSAPPADSFNCCEEEEEIIEPSAPRNFRQSSFDLEDSAMLAGGYGEDSGHRDLLLSGESGGIPGLAEEGDVFDVKGSADPMYPSLTE